MRVDLAARCGLLVFERSCGWWETRTINECHTYEECVGELSPDWHVNVGTSSSHGTPILVLAMPSSRARHVYLDFWSSSSGYGVVGGSRDF